MVHKCWTQLIHDHWTQLVYYTSVARLWYLVKKQVEPNKTIVCHCYYKHIHHLQNAYICIRAFGSCEDSLPGQKQQERAPLVLPTPGSATAGNQTNIQLIPSSHSTLAISHKEWSKLIIKTRPMWLWHRGRLLGYGTGGGEGEGEGDEVQAGTGPCANGHPEWS